MESASIANNSSSGFHKMYLLICLLRQLTNNSISDVPNLSHMKVNMPRFNYHSVAY